MRYRFTRAREENFFDLHISQVIGECFERIKIGKRSALLRLFASSRRGGKLRELGISALPQRVVGKKWTEYAIGIANVGERHGDALRPQNAVSRNLSVDQAQQIPELRGEFLGVEIRHGQILSQKRQNF